MTRHTIKLMKVGDLVRWNKTSQIGIVLDMFGDLDPDNPWVQVMFQGGSNSTQWCKKDSLVIINKGEAVSDLSFIGALAIKSGSL